MDYLPLLVSCGGFVTLVQVEAEAPSATPPLKLPRRLIRKQPWPPAEPPPPRPPTSLPTPGPMASAATAIAIALGLPTVPTPSAELPACIEKLLGQEDDRLTSLKREVRRLQQVLSFSVLPFVYAAIFQHSVRFLIFLSISCHLF